MNPETLKDPLPGANTALEPAAKLPFGEWLAVATYWIVAAQLAFWIVVASAARTQLQETFFAHQSVRGKMHQVVGAIAEGFSLGLIPAATDEARQIQAQAATIRAVAELISKLSWLLMGLSVLLLGFSVIKRGDSFKQVSVWTIRHLLGVSAIFLFVGLLAPVLTMSIAPTVPVLGKVYLDFRSNTIVSAVAALFKTDNWVPATLVLVFSVLVPMTKLAAARVALSAHPERRRSIKAVLDAIGKWSMADVFVVALFLAYLALGAADASTNAKPAWGFYFFAGYCMLSMFASYSLGHIRPEAAEANATGDIRALKWTGYLTRAVVVTAVGVVSCFGLIYFSLGKKAAEYVEASVLHTPIELQRSVVRVSASSTTLVPLSIPYHGTVEIEVNTLRGNALNVFMARADQIGRLRQGKGIPFLNGSRAVNSRTYSRSLTIDEGSYFLVLRDTTLGLLSAPASEISVRAALSP